MENLPLLKEFNILNKLTQLIKDYLKADGMVSKIYIDREFQTIDHCVIMLIDQIVSRYQNEFLNQDEH